jgi:hypothetical protein
MAPRGADLASSKTSSGLVRVENLIDAASGDGDAGLGAMERGLAAWRAVGSELGRMYSSLMAEAHSSAPGMFIDGAGKPGGDHRVTYRRLPT